MRKNKKERKKRSIKQKLHNGKFRINNNLPATIFIFSILLFGITQLYINAILTPKGAKLNALNREKRELIEQNRQLEENIAQNRTLTIISVLAEKKLKLSENTDNRLIYIPEIVTVAQK